MFSSPSPAFESWQRKKPRWPLQKRRWAFLAVMEITLQLPGTHSFHLVHWKDLPGEAAKTSKVHGASTSNTQDTLWKSWLTFMQHSKKWRHPRTPSPPSPVFFIDLLSSCHLSKSTWKAFLSFLPLLVKMLSAGQHQHIWELLKHTRSLPSHWNYSTRIPLLNKSPLLNKIPEWFVCTLKFQKHYFRLPAHDFTHFLCDLILSHIVLHLLFNALRCIP